MPATRTAFGHHDAAFGLGASLLGAASWVWLMWPGGAPLCGHAGLVHCPACYAAAALMALGVAITAAATAPKVAALRLPRRR